MLGFCARTLPQIREIQEVKNLYLEGFLLHYRNVMSFLSGAKHQKDDLSTAKPADWANRVIGAMEIASITGPASSLEDKYHSNISKYLQHCTLKRSQNPLDWDVRQMMDEIQPVIDQFEAIFPRG